VKRWLCSFLHLTCIHVERAPDLVAQGQKPASQIKQICAEKGEVCRIIAIRKGARVAIRTD
jgi:hypothetical protein